MYLYEITILIKDYKIGDSVSGTCREQAPPIEVAKPLLMVAAVKMADPVISNTSEPKHVNESA